MMVVACPAPTMLTESLMYSAPWLPVKSPTTFGNVRVKEHAGIEIVSVPARALARSTASRTLQDEDVSALLVLLQALVIGDVGVGSSVRFTKNVGSGIGKDTEG